MWVNEYSILTSVTLTMSCASGTAFEGRKAAKIIGVEMSSENLRHKKINVEKYTEIYLSDFEPFSNSIYQPYQV